LAKPAGCIFDRLPRLGATGASAADLEAAISTLDALSGRT